MTKTLNKAQILYLANDKILGMTTQRLALDEMLSMLREDDTVVVARFFRLGRNRDHLINLVNEFSKRKVHFKALDVGIDTTTPAGKLILSIFASLAEFDRETILEKTRAGQLLAKAKGKHIGRPIGINQQNYEKVKKALEKHMSVSEIVTLTGISISSVKRYKKRIECK
ncbi:recombinase family protein [Arcicella sp. DC2W]|uniref:Recombinase family protein n=1 Tax=Arcicella gelida TaxID=2984195 RepID=A0ABU5S3C0_9BACT|nr:recombinase family protein [Arcicella sp. DC2W]MEA5402932.1 recombinase family protein [Arcicella sp. DC2W]